MFLIKTAAGAGLLYRPGRPARLGAGERAVTAIPSTPAEAWEVYSFARDPIGWHYQPKCVCGDYITGHEKLPPHRCGFSVRGPSPVSGCPCYRYRFARMGTGPRPEDRERWLAQGCPDWPRPDAVSTPGKDSSEEEQREDF